MGNTEAGLLLYIETPDRIIARWTATHLPHPHAGPLVEALHQDLLAGLEGMVDTTVYLAAVDGQSGQIAWRVARGNRSSYSSPTVANVGGRDVTRAGSAWVGMAGIRDVSTRGYFYSGVQPYGDRGSRELEMGFYSYHLDKRGPWGENYDVQKRIPIEVGKWYCVERHLKLNTVNFNTNHVHGMFHFCAHAARPCFSSTMERPCLT